MQKVILALAFGSAAAFVPASVSRSAPLNSARDELIDLAEGSTEGLSPGFWDPLGCSGMSFWTLDNDQTVGYLRHAEISTAASRWRASSATACSALTS